MYFIKNTLCHIKKKDMPTIEELSDNSAAAISGGRYKKPGEIASIEVLRLKAQGINSEEDLYRGLGMQADNETPLT